MNKVAYHFRGISILIPKQRDHELEALKKKIPHKILKTKGHFKLIRPVANIVLVKKGGGRPTKQPVKTFDPPIEIRVGYNWADVKKCGGDIHKLKLAYWDGKQWVVISDPAHEYFILPPGTARVAEAKIGSWAGDPPLAWGQ